MFCSASKDSTDHYLNYMLAPESEAVESYNEISSISEPSTETIPEDIDELVATSAENIVENIDELRDINPATSTETIDENIDELVATSTENNVVNIDELHDINPATSTENFDENIDEIVATSTENIVESNDDFLGINTNDLLQSIFTPSQMDSGFPELDIEGISQISMPSFSQNTTNGIEESISRLEKGESVEYSMVPSCRKDKMVLYVHREKQRYKKNKTNDKSEAYKCCVPKCTARLRRDKITGECICLNNIHSHDLSVNCEKTVADHQFKQRIEVGVR